MKSLPVLFCIAMLVACESSTDKEPAKDTVAVAKKAIVIDTPDTREVHFERQFSSSSFSSSIFKADSIYGIWTLSNDYPHCGFEINARRFLYCDYDGNGERFFKVVEDSIFLDTDVFLKGRILKAENDSLIIHWDGEVEDNVNIRWTN